MSESEELIGELLLHFSCSLQQNTHDIAFMQTHSPTRWLASNSIVSLGAGVYLTSALFNHSCDPSFMRANVGKAMVSLANRNLRAGEEISECYGQMYYTREGDNRRRELSSHYKFLCHCLPCLENWPTIKVGAVMPSP